MSFFPTPLKPPRFGENTLYALDVDNTIVENKRNKMVGFDPHLLKEFDPSDVLVLNTGRPIQTLREQLPSSILERANFLITREGVAQWLKDGKDWKYDEDSLKACPKGYNPTVINRVFEKVCQEFRNEHGISITDEFNSQKYELGNPTLLLHTLDEELKEKFLKKLHRQLKENQQSDYQVLAEKIVTQRIDGKESGFYLFKFPPKGISKGSTLLSVIHKLKNSYPHLNQLFIAGDADNDLSCFLIEVPHKLKPFFAIVNRHATELYADIMRKLSPESKITEVKTGFHPDTRLYVSAVDPKKSPAPAGLMEAIRFFKEHRALEMAR